MPQPRYEGGAPALVAALRKRATKENALSKPYEMRLIHSLPIFVEAQCKASERSVEKELLEEEARLARSPYCRLVVRPRQKHVDAIFTSDEHIFLVSIFFQKYHRIHAQ